MRRKLDKFVKIAFLWAMVFFVVSGVSESAILRVRNAHAQTSATLPEGRDFSTLHLRDPWDMAQYSDVSQYINISGQALHLQDVKTEDGIFSASSTSSRDAQFFVLWPGYNTAMLIGKVGHNYPVDSSAYRCLYLGMKVNSGAADGGGPDQFQVMWFADELLNGTGGAWGSSKAFPLYPEAGAQAPAAAWKLYKIDLASSANFSAGTQWSGRDAWQGLRIDPTIQANVGFNVDWVRLTDCKAVIHTISLPGGQSASIWVRPDGTTRDFLAASNVQGNSYPLDVQGLPPGTYTYSVKSNNQILATGNFKINQTPIARFPGLSPADGPDYASLAGNPWDFSSGSDFTKTYDIDYSINDGIMDIVTPGGGGVDAIIELNTPLPIGKTSDYRYLAFRLKTDGAWQNVPQGMIARWVWTIPGSSGQAGYHCHLVSQDIPLDVGWRTYTIDLSDGFQGLSEQVAGECGGLPKHWMETSPVVKLRFDPNENIMSAPIHQQLDWIRLTKVKQVTRGQAFAVQVSLNKAPEELEQVTFYYTDNLSDPTQHPAEGQISPAEPPATVTAPQPPSSQAAQKLQNPVFLPVLIRNFYELDFPPVDNGINFSWSTGSVSPGEYYLCAVFEDGYNQASYCSEAPVKVTLP
jgi:hypothetical protein